LLAVYEFVPGATIGGSANRFLSVRAALLNLLVVGTGLEDHAGQEEFLGQLLVPLLAENGWGDSQDAPFAFGPNLRKDKSSLDRLSQPDFIGEDIPFGWGDWKANSAASTR
jgi:hypothetical protein